MGTKNQCINGTFDPTSPLEFTDGQITFVKRNNPDICAAYCKSIESWCVQPRRDKGTSICYAFVKATQRFEQFPVGSICFLFVVLSLTYFFNNIQLFY